MSIIILAFVCIVLVVVGRKIPAVLETTRKHPVAGVVGGIAVFAGAGLVMSTALDRATHVEPVRSATTQPGHAAANQEHQPMGQALRSLFPFMAKNEEQN